MSQIKKENFEKYVYYDDNFIELFKNLSIETQNRELA